MGYWEDLSKQLWLLQTFSPLQGLPERSAWSWAGKKLKIAFLWGGRQHDTIRNSFVYRHNQDWRKRNSEEDALKTCRVCSVSREPCASPISRPGPDCSAGSKRRWIHWLKDSRQAQ
jgi:hypothetical protein